VNKHPFATKDPHETIFDRELPLLLSSNELDSSEKPNFIESQNDDRKTDLSRLTDIKKQKNTNNANNSKPPNPDVDKCGTILLLTSQIAQLKESNGFNQDLPILTLSMAKKLTVSALSGCMSIIQNEIDNIEYYLKTSWRAYKSHRNKKILRLKSHLKLEMNYG
jgi:hypothetical protein